MARTGQSAALDSGKRKRRNFTEIDSNGTGRINGVELVEIEPDFTVAKPQDHILVMNGVLLDRPQYDLINQLIREAFQPSRDIYGLRFHSVGGFIQNAVQEKIERMFVDYEALGKIYQRHLQRDHQLYHHHVRGVNDELFSDE
jgi:hypothetical protein